MEDAIRIDEVDRRGRRIQKIGIARESPIGREELGEDRQEIKQAQKHQAEVGNAMPPKLAPDQLPLRENLVMQRIVGAEVAHRAARLGRH